MAEMALRIASLRTLLPDLEAALQSFTSSSAKFRVVRTVNDTPTQPKTLYILDSSFNPPSIAHLALASSALKQSARVEKSPSRLLLLFSTHNADKAPSPASFVQRIALMTMFAEDLSQSLKNGTAPPHADIANVSIDIGLTKEPYYSDKSVAIAEATPPFYSSSPIHVHLVGYDTLIRFCNPKYYPKYDPPLSALKPFFEAGHKLRVTQRPSDASDESSNEFGTTEEQAKYLQELKDGKQEKAGFKPAWANNIDMVQAEKGVGVSSTRVRKAANQGKWDAVQELCTEGVTAWIKDQGLYSEDASSSIPSFFLAVYEAVVSSQDGRADSPELPNARLSQPTPASRPLLPKDTSSPNSRFTSARSEDLHELREIFHNARDSGQDRATPMQAVRARFSRPSMHSIRSLHKMPSMRSMIRRRFSRDLTKKASLHPSQHSDSKDDTGKARHDTVIKQQKHKPKQQLHITKEDLRKDLLSDKKPDEGGYDSDAEVLDDVARNIGKRSPTKRPSIHSVDWVTSSGSKTTPDSSTKARTSAELKRHLRPYDISKPQPVSLSHRLSQVFSSPNLQLDTCSERDRRLRRSHSATSMGLPKPSPISPLRLPSLSANDSSGVPWSEAMHESLRLSHFPIPPRHVSPKTSTGNLSRDKSLKATKGLHRRQNSKTTINQHCAPELVSTSALHAIDIRVQQPTSIASPRPSTYMKGTLRENPSSKEIVHEDNHGEGDDDNARHSIHLHSMRISHHLRSGSLLSWDQLADAPELPTPRVFHEPTVSGQRRTSPPNRQLSRHNRQTSSSGFASSKIPIKWGKVLPNDVTNRPHVASSVYSSRPQSPLESFGGSMISLSRTGTENVPFTVSSPDLRKPRRSASFPTDNEDTPRPRRRHGLTTLAAPSNQAPESPLPGMPIAPLARKNSVADTKTSKFREEFSPSPPKKKLNQSSSIIKFLNPKRLSLRSQSEADLRPEVSIVSVDGPSDSLGLPIDREHRESQSVISLQAEQEALGKDKDKNHVWDRALQAHQEEKASLFLPKNRDLALNASPFRGRSGSVSTRRTSVDDVDSSSRADGSSRRLSTPKFPTPGEEHPEEHFALYSRRSALAGHEDLDSGQGVVRAFEGQGDGVEVVGAWGRYPSHTRHDRTGSAGRVDNVQPRDFALEVAIKFAASNDNEDLIDPTQRRPSTPLSPGEKKKKKKRVGSGCVTKSNSMIFGRTLMKNYTKMFKSQSTEFRRHGRGHRSSIASGGVLEHPELELLPEVWAGHLAQNRDSQVLGSHEELAAMNNAPKDVAKGKGKLIPIDSMATLRPRRNSSAPNLNEVMFRGGTAESEQACDSARVWSVYYENCVDSYPRLSTDANVALEEFGTSNRVSFDSKLPLFTPNHHHFSPKTTRTTKPTIMAMPATTTTKAYVPLPNTPSLAAMNATLARNLEQFQQGQKPKRPSLTLKLRFNLGPKEGEIANEGIESGETTESDRDTDSAEETQSTRDPKEKEDEKQEEEEEEEEEEEKARPAKRQHLSPKERKGKGKAKQAPAKSPPSRALAKKAKSRYSSSNTKSPPELPKQTLRLRLPRKTQAPAPKLSFRPLKPPPTGQATRASRPAPLQTQKQKQSKYTLRSHLPPTPRILPAQPLDEKPEKWLPTDTWPTPLHALPPHGPRAAWARLFPDELPLGEYGGEPTGWMARMMWKDGEWVERGEEDVYEKMMLGPELARASRRSGVDSGEVVRLEGLMGGF
ncbi:hypothetical protein DDE82_000227 [Stemphylium lycopersici]|nr:hypothetical protein DDE82_000227 [Stemphylium lycopersici]